MPATRVYYFSTKSVNRLQADPVWPEHGQLTNFSRRVKPGGAPMQGIWVNFFLIRTFVSDWNVELLEKYLVNLQMTGTDLTETFPVKHQTLHQVLP